MHKNHFLKEQTISGTQSRNNRANKKHEVMKIQSWLNLFELSHPGSATATAVDGDFGPATERAVKNFQALAGFQTTGKVDKELFGELCKPLTMAFTNHPGGHTIRELIVNSAASHLQQRPMELDISGKPNCGPWVRSYMDGHEGKEWLWCMGFVQSILDNAASLLGKDFRSIMPLSYSCDVVATIGLERNYLTRYSVIRNDPSLVQPGDIFLVQKTLHDWVHTGIITRVFDDTFETIEGNTNNDGSSNGNGVYRRIRNFRKGRLDVLSVEELEH